MDSVESVYTESYGCDQQPFGSEEASETAESGARKVCKGHPPDEELGAFKASSDQFVQVPITSLSHRWVRPLDKDEEVFLNLNFGDVDADSDHNENAVLQINQVTLVLEKKQTAPSFSCLFFTAVNTQKRALIKTGVFDFQHSIDLSFERLSGSEVSISSSELGESSRLFALKRFNADEEYIQAMLIEDGWIEIVGAVLGRESQFSLCKLLQDTYTVKEKVVENIEIPQNKTAKHFSCSIL